MERPGHYYLFPSKRCSCGRGGATLLDTPGSRGLFQRDGAHPPGAGLRHPGHQRHRRRAGPHPHPLAVLERYGVPTFLFVNKMDLAGADKAALLAGLKAGLDEGCVDFYRPGGRTGQAALCREDAGGYLEDGALDGDTLTALIARRKLFPCWFGSALKLEGWPSPSGGWWRTPPRPRMAPFAARVFKISRDNQGTA